MYPNQQLKGAMAEKGITVEQLANKSGLAFGTVSAIRNGKMSIKLASLVTMAVALDFEVEIRLIPKTQAKGKLARGGVR